MSVSITVRPEFADRRPVLCQTKLRKVLVIDDERVIADTLAKIFSRFAYETRAVYSAEQALELIFRDEWCPELLITDVYLPGMNGVELGILLRNKCPGCHVILASGQPQTEDLLQGAKRDGHSFHVISKPSHPTEFLNLASRLLSGGHSRQSIHESKIALPAAMPGEDFLNQSAVGRQ